MLKEATGFLIVVFLVGSIFLPIDIPYAFESTAKVFPLQEWSVVKRPDGSLVSTLHHYQTGLLRDFSSFQFDRGDVIQVQFNKELLAKPSVDSGALIATILSNTLDGRLVELENEKAIETANLKRTQAGAKPELIQQVKEELRLAEEEVNLRQLQLTRAEEMLKNELIARSEYEVAENALVQSQNALVVAKEKISVATSGEKPEQVAYIESKIQSIQKEIDFLNTTTGNYAIYTPIGGKVTYKSDAAGDQIIIEDASERIILLPIRLRDRDYIDENTKFEFSVPGIDSLLTADLVGIEEKVEYINNDVVVIAKLLMNKGLNKLATGMPLRCKVTCEEVRPIEYFKRSAR